MLYDYSHNVKCRNVCKALLVIVKHPKMFVVILEVDIHFSLFIITSDASLRVKSVNSLFIKFGSSRSWNLYATYLSVKDGTFSALFVYLFYYQIEHNTLNAVH